jgi:hypothetical protein
VRAFHRSFRPGAGQSPSSTQSPAPLVLLLHTLASTNLVWGRGYALSSRIEDLCLPVEPRERTAPDKKKPGSCDPGMQLVVARINCDSMQEASEPRPTLSCSVAASSGFSDRGREFNHLAALFRGEPFHFLVKTRRNVELNHLSHSHPPIHTSGPHVPI